MKKEVNVCDVCNKGVADNSCNFCKKDVCSNCDSYVTIDIYNGQKNPYLDKVKVCKECYNNISRVESDDFPDEFKKEIRELMMEQLKKIALVKAFDKTPKPKKYAAGGKIGNFMGMPIITSNKTIKDRQLKSYLTSQNIAMSQIRNAVKVVKQYDQEKTNE